MTTIIRTPRPDPALSELTASPCWHGETDRAVNVDELSSVHRRIIFEASKGRIQSIHHKSPASRSFVKLGAENIIQRSRTEIDAIEDLVWLQVLDREEHKRYFPDHSVTDVFHS